MRVQRLASIAFVVAIGACAGAPGATPTPVGSAPTATALASAMPSVAPPSATPTPAIPDVTPLPSVFIPGDMPGPDSTVPPGVAVIPNLRIETVAGIWEALGLACDSVMANYPDSDGFFGNLGCERKDVARNADYHVSVVYWTPEGIASVRLLVLTITDDQRLDPGAVASLFLPSVQVIAGEDAATWVEDHLGDQGCRSGCARTFSRLRFDLSIGSDSVALLHIDANP